MANQELLNILTERMRMFDNQRKVNEKILELKGKAKKFKQEQEEKEEELIKEIIKTENRIKNGK